MDKSSTYIQSIYNSRNNILEILEERNYNVEQYKNINLNEINILNQNGQLDLLVSNKENNKKIYIKYYINKLIKPQNIFSIVEDIFHLENLLEKNDDLIIIMKEEPNETLIQTIKDIWVSENIYISLLNIKRLQFNILKHNLVPKHIILNDNESTEFKKKFNILNNEQIPEISFFSPISLVMGIRPDNIVKIIRKSPTSINTVFYRICKI